MRVQNVALLQFVTNVQEGQVIVGVQEGGKKLALRKVRIEESSLKGQVQRGKRECLNAAAAKGMWAVTLFSFDRSFG